MSTAADVVVVGSGFAGTILARALASRGRAVVLLEKSRHPRFALGESSTPLAAIALERLATDFGLDDLAALAAHGRWLASLPELRRGLKRGFTFYRHVPRQDLVPEPTARLLVAASPDDRVADCHWLRSDVDAHLVRAACAEGVDYRDGFEVMTVETDGAGVVLRGRQDRREHRIEAKFVVDASGRAGAVAGSLGAALAAEPARFSSALVFGHFSGVEPLTAAWAESGTAVRPGPYADESAAVHHLLDEGWVYSLRFDHDCVSAGAVLDPAADVSNPDTVWAGVLSRYPLLARQFARAAALRPLRGVGRIQYRREKAVGRYWAALPHAYAFFDPMFSTGIAWSLLGAERLAHLLLKGQPPAEAAVRSYGSRLAAEADQIERLIFGAMLARKNFRLFAAHSQLYFALVSFAEVRQRLLDPAGEGWRAEGFLGAGDPWAEALLEESVRRLEAGETNLEAYEAWVEEAIRERNIAGLADPARRNLYPVDLEVLVERAHLLGMKRDEMRALLPRLRGHTT